MRSASITEVSQDTLMGTVTWLNGIDGISTRMTTAQGEKGKTMTITKYDRFALLPKRCDECNRLFWLEPYNTKVIKVGIEHYPLDWIVCKECSQDGERKDDDPDDRPGHQLRERGVG